MTSSDEKHVSHNVTAEQPMAGGLLIEVEPLLRQEAGYRWSVRITPGVASLVTPKEDEVGEGQSLDDRLWDTLRTARIAIGNADRQESVIPFEVALGGRTATLWACLDTTRGPGIRIIRPEESLRGFARATHPIRCANEKDTARGRRSATIWPNASSTESGCMR